VKRKRWSRSGRFAGRFEERSSFSLICFYVACIPPQSLPIGTLLHRSLRCPYSRETIGLSTSGVASLREVKKVLNAYA